MKMAVMMLKEKKREGRGGEKVIIKYVFSRAQWPFAGREIIPVVKLVCACVCVRVGPEVYYCNLVKLRITSLHAAVRSPSCV